FEIETVGAQADLGPEFRPGRTEPELIPETHVDAVIQATEARVDPAPGVAAGSPCPRTDVPRHMHAAIGDGEMHPAAVTDYVEERTVGVNIHFEIAVIDLGPDINPGQLRTEHTHRAGDAHSDIGTDDPHIRPAGERRQAVRAHAEVSRARDVHVAGGVDRARQPHIEEVAHLCAHVVEPEAKNT